jgi:X-X-X-Leu-X-X-Gly heptad repeat protein
VIATVSLAGMADRVIFEIAIRFAMPSGAGTLSEQAPQLRQGLPTLVS